MEFAALDRSVRTARRGRNLAVVLLVTMIGANALLGLRLLNQSNQVVLIPTQVSDGMVARGAVDKRYVEALALDAVYAMYNATPETLDYGRQVLDRLSSLRERSAILDQYDRIATDMRERKISTVFFPEKLEHNYAAGRFRGAGGAALRGEREPDLQVAARPPIRVGSGGGAVASGGTALSAGGDRR
jgi:conjugal transfer pilus assembly protein TraE